MPLIPAPPALPDRDTLALRIDRDLHAQLREYAEFLHTTKDYIVSSALKRVFRYDKEFLAWHQARNASETHPIPVGTARPALLPADAHADTTRAGNAEAARRPAGKDRA